MALILKSARRAFGKNDALCLTRPEVLKRLKHDVKEYGGQLVLLEDGLEQSFADQWRREVHVPAIKVSGVVAHVFGDESEADWSADVVEFDASGCAMSRTIVPGDVWVDLLKSAVGVEI